MPQSEFMSVTEVAEATGYDPGHVRRLLIAGTIKAVKVSDRNWVIRRDDVEAFQRAHERDPRGRPRRDAATDHDDTSQDKS